MKLFLGSLALVLGAAGIAFALLRFVRQERRAAVYACLECGRREWREYEGRELVSSRLGDDGSAFSQRFGAALPPDHAHDWMVDGCIFEGGKLSYTGDTARHWIEILPRLSDSAGAEALFREAIAGTREERRELIESFVRAVPGGGKEGDEAFAHWNTQRRSR